MLRFFGGGSDSKTAKNVSGSGKLKHVKTRAGIDGIIDGLKPTVFFYATEDSQIRALNALNGFIATKSKLEKALRCQQSLVLILYEFSTMSFFRARMSSTISDSNWSSWSEMRIEPQ